MGIIVFCLGWLALGLGVLTAPARAESVPITILHTNDLHSHYKPDKGYFGLGGITRLSTAIRRVRDSVPNTLLLDGGDWSEGSIYYTLDAGRTSLEILDTLGYDAAVMGNHDWLNGPDHLLKLLKQAQTSTALLGANLDFSKYQKGAEIDRFILPYKVFKRGGLKIAVIGLVTYELIYDKWFAPVEIKEPFALCRKLAAQLKKEADLVVVISHNGLSTNQLVAGMANVDVVVHAHDHMKLPRPIVVDRNGKQSYIVEAHQWGYYLGRLDLSVDTATKKVTMRDYELIQIDQTVPEDPALVALVDNYDLQLDQKYGREFFTESIGDLRIDLRRDSRESLYGNLLADAYREHTGADIAMEQVLLTSGELHAGPLVRVDIFNALSAIFNVTTGKAWTLKTMRMTGETLSWVMNLIVSLQNALPRGLVSASGLYAVYDPVMASQIRVLEGDTRKALKYLEIGGKPVDPVKSYLVALPHGLVEALDFLESMGNKIDRTDVKDTGVEDWVILTEYLRRHAPLDSSAVPRGRRIAVLQSDLALYSDDVVVTRAGTRVEASVRIRNLGTTASSARQLRFTYDKTPRYIVDDPNPAAPAALFAVPAVNPGDSVAIRAAVDLVEEMKTERVPLYLTLTEALDDPNKTNDGTWIMAK